MRQTFFQLTETVTADNGDNTDVRNSAESQERIKSLVRRGLARRPDIEDSIWDEMLSLFGQNRTETAAMFGVRPEAISRGMGRLRNALQSVRDEVGIENKKRTRSSMLHTGI